MDSFKIGNFEAVSQYYLPPTLAITKIYPVHLYHEIADPERSRLQTDHEILCCGGLAPHSRQSPLQRLFYLVCPISAID